MTTALWMFVGLAVLSWIGAALLWRAARGTDDFGIGLLFWVVLAIGVVFALLAFGLWLANLYASGFR